MGPRPLLHQTENAGQLPSILKLKCALHSIVIKRRKEFRSFSQVRNCMPTQQEGRVTSCGVGAEGRGDLAPRDSSTFSASLRDKIWRLPGYHPKKRREEDSTNFLREHGYGISEYEKVNH